MSEAEATAPQADSEHLSDEYLPEREVRVGLVLYGGVSLAIYINGVAQEFYRAVRGQGAYTLLKLLTDSDITVDIISGSSAGGVNGVLLAYALCNEADFSQCMELWRKHGDIEKLTRGAESSAGSNSVLSGEYYFERLQEAFCRMRENPPDGPGSGAAGQGLVRSATPELDLFITGTNARGWRGNRKDGQGAGIAIKEHETLFHVKHRKDRKEPFRPRVPADGSGGKATLEETALAKLALITSCFPCAFPPVRVSGGGDPVDSLLRQWGAFEGEAYLMDGGILDNYPFSSTLREIYHRTTTRKVKRILFWVDPNPESHPAGTASGAPDILAAFWLAFREIPAYESIAQDLRQIDERNHRLRLYLDYRTGLNAKSLAGSEAAGSVTSEAYLKARLFQLGRLAVEALVQGSGRSRPVPAASVEALAKVVANQKPDTASRLLAEFDVDFRMRRLFHLIYAAYDARPASPDDHRRKWTLIALLNRHVQLLEIVRWAMEKSLGRMRLPEVQGSEGAQRIWDGIRALLGHLLDSRAGFDFLQATGHAAVASLKGSMEVFNRFSGSRPGTATGRRMHESLPWLAPEHLDKVRAILGDRISSPAGDRAASADGSGGSTDPGAASLLLRIDELEKSVLTGPWSDFNYAVLEGSGGAKDGQGQGEAQGTPGVFRAGNLHAAFESMDGRLLPLELFSDMREKDLIHAARISPVDAQKGFSRRPYMEKLAGDSLGSFGGFFKRSWRSNDILWGRLDGLCQIFSTLLTRERLVDLAEDSRFRARVRDRLGIGGGDGSGALAAFFPFGGGDAAKLDELAGILADLVSENPAARAEAMRGFDRLLDLLIEASHAEILREGIDSVAEDAVRQRRDWGGFGRLPAFVGEGSGAPSLGRSAAELGRMFRSDYAVGKETWEDIPTLILLRMAVKALASAFGALTNLARGRRRVSPMRAFAKVSGWALRLVFRLIHAVLALVTRGKDIGGRA